MDNSNDTTRHAISAGELMAKTFTPAETAAFNWSQLESFLNEWFYQPDLDALRLTLAAACAHYHAEADPIWLFLIGPPGCGKTSIGIQACIGLPNTYIMGDLTDKTLISGYRGNPGLLHNLGISIIFLFKDFTTMLSKRHEARGEIIGQLREVYDGVFGRNTGGANRLPTPWKGKATCIAAVTPAIENHWAVMRELGERFMIVRWPRGGINSATFARRQRDRENHIRTRLPALVNELVKPSVLPKPKPLPENMALQCDHLAEMVAILRGTVPRANHGMGEIAAPPIVESPTRIAKTLNYITATYAAIMRRDSEAEDMRLARRCALDTIPRARYRVFANIPYGADIGANQLCQLGHIPESSVYYQVQELNHLGVIKIEQTTTEQRYSYTEPFKLLLQRSGLQAAEAE